MASESGEWRVVNIVTDDIVWPGTFFSEDGAKQMLRRFQRAFNRDGYSPESEALGVRFFPDV